MPGLAKKEKAARTIEDLKQNHPDCFNSLEPHCRKCMNILSSYECDCCEDFDMYQPIN